MKILRPSEVCARTGLSNTTIWRKERAGKFPKRVQLGPGAVGWLENEVDAWIAALQRGPISANTLNAVKCRANRPAA